MKYFVADRCVWIELTGIEARRMIATFEHVTGRGIDTGWHADLRIYITSL